MEAARPKPKTKKKVAKRPKSKACEKTASAQESSTAENVVEDGKQEDSDMTPIPSGSPSKQSKKTVKSKEKYDKPHTDQTEAITQTSDQHSDPKPEGKSDFNVNVAVLDAPAVDQQEKLVEGSTVHGDSNADNKEDNTASHLKDSVSLFKNVEKTSSVSDGKKGNVKIKEQNKYEFNEAEKSVSSKPPSLEGMVNVSMNESSLIIENSTLLAQATPTSAPQQSRVEDTNHSNIFLSQESGTPEQSIGQVQSSSLSELEAQRQQLSVINKLTMSPPPVEAACAGEVASAPPLIDLEDTPALLQTAATTASAVAVTRSRVAQPQETEVIYPKLESHWEGEVALEDLVPYSEEDLTLFSPNPQLDSNQLFIDNFLTSISNMSSETHILYDLLMTYLKTKRTLTHCVNHLSDLRKTYKNSNDLTWLFENKQASSTGRCGDGSKVSHSYPYKVAVFYADHLIKATSTLKEIRQLLDEELCIKRYNSQLARVHVEHHLYLLMRSVPGLEDFTPSSLVASWVPFCPPGSSDNYCAHLRDSISVLFHFERQPVADEEFSADCRKWLTQLTSVLMRVSSLSEHQFLLNHLLRCPAGVGSWGAELLQVAPPTRTRELLQSQLQTRGNSHYSQDWGVEFGLHGDWGGPVLDHFMTSLATLMLPIKEREKFLACVNAGNGSPSSLSRNASVPWAFIDEMDEDCKAASKDVLSESDYIFFFNQFPFSNMFAHILQFTSEEEYSLSRVTSHQMMRLIAFCTCLVQLLGTGFSTLRLARYKEFSKQVGQTIRYAVAFVSDHWSAYRAHRILRGDDLSNLPTELQSSEYKHSLNRLQLEFDQFVLRSIKWILTAQKLGAWQFLADMPYGTISLSTTWTIFWNIYCKSSIGDTSQGAAETGGEEADQGGGAPAPQRPFSPRNVDDIQEAMKAGSHKDLFVDRLMKTYTSEAVYLLTTLVNMVRARSCDSHAGSRDAEAERRFINTVTLEIFECTHVVEYARETYFKTGSDLLDSIAVVHPFVISTLLGRVETAIGAVGENCIMLFKKLSLHLWVPHPRDMELIQGWLLEYPLNSSENTLARNILSALNWGTKAKAGSFDLVLPWSMHCSTALCLVNALARHLPYHPGGRDYTPGSVGKYTTRFTTSQSQVEFEQWVWEVALMLKLHPHQVTSYSTQMLCPSTLSESTASGATGTAQSRVGPRDRAGTLSQSSGLEPPPWVYMDPASGELLLPNIEYAGTVAVPELAELREAAKNEGLLAYYVTLSITTTGSDTDHFISKGLSKLHHLVEEGQFKAALRLLANILPRFFKHTKILLQDSTFLSILLALANADSEGATMKEKWITGCVSKVTKMLSALIQTQLVEASTPGYAGGGGGGGGEQVLKFWLEVLLSCPTWYKEGNILFLLNNIAMAAYFNTKWAETLENTLLESYQALTPLQPKKGLMSSVYSSVASMMWQDGGTPSLFNAIPHKECPWLSYSALCAEQRFQEEKKIWRELLLQLKRDEKILLDTAMKRAFSELKTSGSFPTSHLCLYRWAEFCNTLDNMHPVAPLVWQRFFTIYLSRAPTATGEAGKEGYGHRFFSSSHSHSQLRELKSSLLAHCRKLQTYIAALETPEWAEKVGVTDSSDGKRDTLRSFYPKCLNRCGECGVIEDLYLEQFDTRFFGRTELEIELEFRWWKYFKSKHDRNARFYQTLRLWLEEPRLHTPNLYFPGLPPSYDAARLASIFQGTKSPWVEFVPEWDLKVELNSMVVDWMQLAAYQKSLPFEPQPSQLKQSTAASRIHNRLQSTSLVKGPPDFQFCHPPFSPLPENVLLSKESLVEAVEQDMELLLQQAKVFSSSMLLLTVYDDDYAGGVPELYTNDPRQFHVRMPCRKMFARNHKCASHATIVFRFNEATISSKWEGQLHDNRQEWGRAVDTLSAPLDLDLVQRLSRLEHSVAELSRMAMQNKEFVQNGVVLFYRVLEYYQDETRKYPPSKQFLSSCISVLGQTFVQQDPQQASTILNLLIMDAGNSDILAPLFQPNLCPEQFVRMYESIAELAEKQGPTVAFSVLTKFNVLQWLEMYNRSFLESDDLLKWVAKGLNLFGAKPEGPSEALVEMYRQHFVLVLNHEFPKPFQSALQVVLNGTEARTLAVNVWEDFRKVLTSTNSPDTCRMGLQQLEFCLHSFTSTYGTLRYRHQSSAFSLVDQDYVPCIGLFLRQLCFCLVNRISDDITMDDSKMEKGVHMCWRSMVGVFEPWLFVLQQDPAQDVLLPCTEGECVQLREMMELFVDVVSYAHNKFQEHDPSSPVLSLMWSHYISVMTRPQLTHLILDIYHASLERLPWKHFYPDLGILESMMKLKMDGCIPSQCFVFLGTIFPIMDWLTITRELEFVGSEDAAVHLHIMVLQLLVMLISERSIMQRDDTSMPQLILQAQDFHWSLIDAKMFQDVVSWQKDNCVSSNILHKGSSLSLSMRLLKSAAGFPSSTGPCPVHQLNHDTWEKRFILVRVMVELIADASHRMDSQHNDYTDCVSSLLHMAVDISIQEPDERFSPRMISLMQEILNLLNVCSTEHGSQESVLKVILYLFQQLPSCNILALPTITAACQSVASLPLMVQLIEQVLFNHFQGLQAPPSEPLQLKQDPGIYGWKSVVDFMIVSEEVKTGLMEAAMEHCCILFLYAVMLKDLLQCTCMADEMQLVPGLVQKCSTLKPKPTDEVKLLLLWMKVLNLLLRQLQYVPNSIPSVLPHFITLVSVFTRFGEDRSREGLLSKLGWGKKSEYAVKFRLIARSLGVFLQCQMPVDNSSQVQLRLVPNAPGHVKDDSHRHSSSSSVPFYSIIPTKQNEQALQSLESMLSSKEYSSLTDSVTSAINFTCNPANSVPNCLHILMLLTASLYPEYRFLDLLRS